MSTNTNITVTGVDLGSSAVKIAAVLKGGVEIITNEANFRQTPNIVGLGQKERLVGEAGQVKIKSNHSNTVTAPSRFLGFDKACPYLSEQLKFCPAKSQKIQNQNSRLAFNLVYGQEKQSFTPEQLVASYITEIQKIVAQTNNLSNKNLVIAVPTYFTQHERKALLNAVQISKKKMNNEYATQLVNQEVAISMDYGYSKRNQFSEDLQKAKKVLFIDFGHSKANAFVTAFNKQHFRVLATKFERQLGCKFMDDELLKFYAQKFDSAHPNMQLNLLQSKKAVLKLLQSIEKQRKVLSGNNEHELNIECLLEDEDIHYSMKRNDFQQICHPIIEKFKNLLMSFFNELKQKGITFDSIQLIGGGTRIPAIINAISEIFGMEPSRTINSNECVARGAALISAMNSSIFRVQPYSFFTISPYAIELKLNNEKVEKKLIDKNELLVKEKSLTFEVDNSTQKLIITVQYQQQNIEAGLETRIFECQVEAQLKNTQKPEETTEMKEETEQARKTKLNLSINFDHNGLILLDKLTSENNVMSIKIGKVNYFEKFSSAELAQMQQKQKDMTIKDLRIKKFYEKKNEYESFIYKNKHNIEGIVSANQEYVSDNKMKEIKAFIDAEQIWLNSGLENDGNLKAEDFSKREKLMNQKIQEFSVSINQLKQSHALVNAELQKLADLLNQIVSKRSQNMYPDDVNKVGEWVNEIFQKEKNSPKCLAPVISPEQVRQVHQELIHKINEFDQQIQRQRQMNQRRKPQYQPRNPYGTFRPAETAYHPYGGRAHEQDYYRPRTTRNNRGGHYNNNSNPFGSFFGSGFSNFF